MFFRRNRPEQQRPAVKKVSKLVNSKSHIQKKYISLMLVPSYSTGKTRSLRIPRVVLYGFIVVFFVIFAVVSGFYVRSVYFQQRARSLGSYYQETQGAFDAFREEAEQVQSDLIDATTQMYEQLSEEQTRAQMEMYRQERRHQNTLENMWDLIEEIEDQIRDLEEDMQGIVSGLSTRVIIPPIADLITEMEESHKELRESLMPQVLGVAYDPPAVGFLSHNFTTLPSFSEDELLGRLSYIKTEVEIQRILLDDLEVYNEAIAPYLLNYPTLWPVAGHISSGFGWRRNPFGGSGREHHNGVDIPARKGTPIRAAGGGTVVFAGWRAGFGNTIVIDHGNGLKTKYAHNTSNEAQEGERVERGEIIAYVGSTGRSTGPHLHYEVHRNGSAINPVAFLLEHF
ncbi:MAG: peptidoglycan DD-metalloendopeptidase family protein [Defluviitaleaceae bacterium]|nr:peptidoglycan DD-metalloendopeptidase family protein [Defluviitaleaceae bacterium]